VLSGEPGVNVKLNLLLMYYLNCIDIEFKNVLVMQWAGTPYMACTDYSDLRSGQLGK